VVYIGCCGYHHSCMEVFTSVQLERMNAPSDASFGSVTEALLPIVNGLLGSYIF